MGKLFFYRIGSDPEFVFGKEDDWDIALVGADTIISKNKSVTLNTFIGTDGHAATAELRPAPAHNIKLHLYNIAFALDKVQTYIDKLNTSVSMFARPTVGGEPCGGHIHASFFVDEPITKQVMCDYNLIYTLANDLGKFDINKSSVPVELTTRSLLEKYCEEAYTGALTSPRSFAEGMNFLIYPFELFSQGWNTRVKRNAKYGSTNNDSVRWLTTPHPKGMYPKWAFMHYEYRVPSTWLIHPTLAYVYLALAKFQLLNWYRVVPIRNTETSRIPGQGEEAANKAYTWFTRRFRVLWTGDAIISKDLRELPSAIERCRELRKSWANPYAPVDIIAWRKLL